MDQEIHLAFTMNIKPESRAEFEALLKEVVAHSKDQPGCIRFIPTKNQADENQYVLIETWASKEALDTYRNLDSSKEVREKVAPLLSGPPTWTLSKAAF